jgi:hypothetical protein
MMMNVVVVSNPNAGVRCNPSLPRVSLEKMIEQTQPEHKNDKNDNLYDIIITSLMMLESATNQNPNVHPSHYL